MRRGDNAIDPTEVLPRALDGEPGRREKCRYFIGLSLASLDEEPAARNDQPGRRVGDGAICRKSIPTTIQGKSGLETGNIRR